MRAYFSILLCAISTGLFNPAYALNKPDSVFLASVTSRANNLVLSQPDSAIHLAKGVLTRANEEQHRYLQGFSYYILAKAYWTKANFRVSTEYGFKALRILENSEFTHLWGETLLAVGRTFTELRNFNEAQTFLRRARALAQQSGDSSLMADTYREHSMLLSETGQYDSALYYADQGLQYYESKNDSLNVSILLGRKAKVYMRLGDYAKSNYYNRRAMQLDSLVGNARALGFSYFYAAENARKLHRPDEAMRWLKKSIATNQDINNLPMLVRAHTLLSTLYHEAGKLPMALQHLTQAGLYKDSLYRMEISGQTQEMQLLYELEDRDKTIEQLGQANTQQERRVRNQRVMMAVLAFGMLLLGAFILLLSRLRTIQTKANNALAAQNLAMEQQKEEMQAQAESLHQLNQLKSKLFSVISHDVRGPIANLQSLLDLLTAKIMTPQEFMALSDKLKTNLNITQRTLENLLNWSLSQMDGIKTESTTVDIKSAIDEACNLLEEFAVRKDVSVRNSTVESVAVWVDPNQLQLILRNLIHNAVKFSKPGGQVEVNAECLGQVCFVRVKDGGIGLTIVEKARLLNAQEYFTKTGTHQEKGTGLGFLLCQEFITRNGGQLEIDSEPGRGTEVSFTVPCVQ